MMRTKPCGIWTNALSKQEEHDCNPSTSGFANEKQGPTRCSEFRRYGVTRYMSKDGSVETGF